MKTNSSHPLPYTIIQWCYLTCQNYSFKGFIPTPIRRNKLQIHSKPWRFVSFWMKLQRRSGGFDTSGNSLRQSQAARHPSAVTCNSCYLAVNHWNLQQFCPSLYPKFNQIITCESLMQREVSDVGNEIIFLWLNASPLLVPAWTRMLFQTWDLFKAHTVSDGLSTGIDGSQAGFPMLLSSRVS